jgi:fermentation-respiration switch protein FrsA (DUF1100 family)
MSISPELMLAILAMDSYNRGYNAGIKSPNAGPNEGLTGNMIGNASIESQSSSLLDSPSRNASFFAISYSYNGQTVISYRGTDNYYPRQDNDITTGWVTGAGFIGTQANLAQAFFKTVVQGNSSLPTDQAALRASNVVLTGHSLGGGLAAYLAGVYGKEAVIYDNMPFELAALRLYMIAPATIQRCAAANDNTQLVAKHAA